MALVKSVQKTAARPVPVATKTATPAKKGIDPIKFLEGADIYDEGDIEFISRVGGGREAAPEVVALKNKVRSLKVGQGFIVPPSMVTKRPINGANGQSILWTYKGAPVISRMAKQEGKKFRTKRDTQGNMYIFRVTPPEVVESEETEQ